MGVGVRVEIQPTLLGLPGQAGTHIRYNVVVVDEKARIANVIAKNQRTTVPLPEVLQQEITELMERVGAHMGGVVGLGSVASSTERAAEDGTEIQKVSDEEQEL